MTRLMAPAALRTRSPRHLAGSRANKHWELVGTMRSDELVKNWRAIFGPAAVRAERSGDLDGARLLRLLANEDRDLAQGSKPDHAARAVDIDACFPGRGRIGEMERMTRRLAAEAGAASASAASLSYTERLLRYATQAHRLGRPRPVTSKQRRRAWHKARKAWQRGDSE